jgi:hypothetical protein
MQMLGHSNFKNILQYTQPAKLRVEDDEFVCKVAKTPSQVQELIENGFEYICDMDDLKFFKKRK